MQNSCIPQITKSSTLNCDTTTSTNSLCSHELSPKNGSIKKSPIRRRSRASKRTPTTHLNADASNFRALVQQFTGCHTANTFLGAHKGPINLNFGLDENSDDFEEDNTITHVSSFGYDCYNCNDTQKEKGGVLVSVNENKTFGSSSTTNSSNSTTLDIGDFELENLCLSDFTGDDQLITESIWDHDGYLLI